MSSILTPDSPSTSPSLLCRACEGDALAWQRVVQIYGPMVYRWARRTGLQPHDAADVTQETFVAIATRLSHFRSDRPGATFRGWLRTITRHKAADLVRSRMGQAAVRGGSTNLASLEAISVQKASQPTDHSIEGDLAFDEQREKQVVVRRALFIMRSSFEKHTWQAFWRVVVDGCLPDEVATELGISRWSVYKARARVLHRLRSELDGLEELE